MVDASEELDEATYLGFTHSAVRIVPPRKAMSKGRKGCNEGTKILPFYFFMNMARKDLTPFLTPFHDLRVGVRRVGRRVGVTGGLGSQGLGSRVGVKHEY